MGTVAGVADLVVRDLLSGQPLHLLAHVLVAAGIVLPPFAWLVGLVGRRRVQAAPWGEERSGVTVLGPRPRPYDQDQQLQGDSK